MCDRVIPPLTSHLTSHYIHIHVHLLPLRQMQREARPTTNRMRTPQGSIKKSNGL
jgi:hypothetical protein